MRRFAIGPGAVLGALLIFGCGPKTTLPAWEIRAWLFVGQHERGHIPLHDARGETIAEVSEVFLRRARDRGVGRLLDGRIVQWRVTDDFGAGHWEVPPEGAPWGIGDSGEPLDPYRSIAANPGFLPLGTVVEIPDLVGWERPDGVRHDGRFRVDQAWRSIEFDEVAILFPSEHAFGRFVITTKRLWTGERLLLPGRVLPLPDEDP